MEYEVRMQQLEKKLSELREKVEYKKCPLCYGSGEMTTPSKEIDYTCWTCGGSGKVKRD